MGRNTPFLGRGWGFPPSFPNQGADVAMADEVEDIRQSLEIILATEPGERVMREDFGCGLRRYVFEEVDRMLLTSIRTAVSDAILRHETRIRLDTVEVSEGSEAPGLLAISIRFTVRATNSRYNLVYPFYVAEASRLGP